ncbi:MAG: hypothetical protein O3B73_07515 [bacterium]|nr:hypothetical protein [bacterium]
MMNATRYYGWIIALVALVLFSRVITHEHVLDDRALIPNHPLLQGPVDVRQILFGRYWANLRTQDTLYRPMTIGSLALAHWVNIHLGLPGDHPVVFRVTSTLLHAGVSVLVFIFVRWLGLSPVVGLWSGLLFAALPIHTEAVAAAVNRSEMLALGFSLAFLIWFQRRWVLSGACLLLALLSKESAILMLPVALWAAAILHMRPRRILLRYALVYGGIVVLWWMLRSEAIGTVLQAVVMLDNPLALVSATQRILTALAV